MRAHTTATPETLTLQTDDGYPTATLPQLFYP